MTSAPLTGSLALVAGGASGLVAIARELGGDDRVVAVVQYLRVALVTASMPIVVTLFFHADRSHHSAMGAQTDSAPWYLSVAMMAVLIAVGAAGGRLVRMPGAGLLGPDGVDHRLAAHRAVVRPFGALRAGPGRLHADRLAGRRRVHPGVAARDRAGAARGHRPDRRARRRHRRPRRRLLAHIAGISPLEGYLATSPGGVYAVLATAVETGSNVTFIIAAQVLRVLLMLFAAPLLARTVMSGHRSLRRSEPGDHRGQQGTHPRRRLTAGGQHLVVAQRLSRDPRRQVRHQRHRRAPRRRRRAPRSSRAPSTCRPDRRRACAASGSRRAFRSAAPAGLRRRPRPVSGRPRGPAPAAAASTRRPGRRTARPTSGERAVRFRWSLISTGCPTAKSARRPPAALVSTTVLHARRAGRAHRVHDVAQVVALVGVDPAEQHQHPVIARSAPTARRRRDPPRSVA